MFSSGRDNSDWAMGGVGIGNNWRGLVERRNTEGGSCVGNGENLFDVVDQSMAFASPIAIELVGRNRFCRG